MNQRDMQHGIDVGPGMHQVCPASYWHKHGHFKNEDEARGAFRLAYQQGLDGMGKSIPHWMGLTEKEYALWMERDEIPKRRLEEIALDNRNMANRWVAYLDILGIKNLIETDFWTHVFEVYAKAIKHFKQDSFDAHLLRRATFSDSFLLYTTDDSALSFCALDSFVRYFIVSLVRNNIPVRGAMSFDGLYADETNNLYFGKALVEAYKISELQDWIGFVLCDTSVRQLAKLKLPANERLNYADYPVPLKEKRITTYKNITFPAFIIGHDPSSTGQKACREALLNMRKEQNDENVKKKYSNTLEFLKIHTRNPVNQV